MIDNPSPLGQTQGWFKCLPAIVCEYANGEYDIAIPGITEFVSMEIHDV